jgi:hypothetical protein
MKLPRKETIVEVFLIAALIITLLKVLLAEVMASF